MELWELAAREEIHQLLAAYAHGVDRGRFADVAQLFAAGGVLDAGNDRGASGRAAIEEFLSGVDRSGSGARGLAYIRHHVSSVVIDLTARDHARVESYFLVVTDRGVDHWGRYRDDVVHDGARWRFARRVARTDGVARGSWAEQRLARD